MIRKEVYSYLQQGRTYEAEESIKRLYGKGGGGEVMRDFNAARQGSGGDEATWFDLFSSRYWKGKSYSRLD